MARGADTLDRFAARTALRFGDLDVCRTSGPRLPGALPDDTVVVWDLPHDDSADERIESAGADLRRLTTTIVVGGSSHSEDPRRTDLPPPTFAGWSPLDRRGRRRPVRVFTSERLPAPARAPGSFGVAAIMTAYNEADIVRSTIEGLIAQGIEVHLVDNWSTDGTPELVEDLVGNGLLQIEHFPPEGRPDHYEWERLLQHTTEVAASLRHDWCVHHDVDQRRDAPWPHLRYRDALWTAQQWGFSAMDHTIAEFRPVDDAFVPGTEVSEHLHWFEWPHGVQNVTHVQAWRNLGRVDLVGSGGHDATFERKRVFPFNAVLRHYPVRSQGHGDTKVFQDRAPRYRVEELERGWHYHYSRLRPGHRFVRDRATLVEYDPASFLDDHLVQVIGQNGFPGTDDVSERIKLRIGRLATAARRAVAG